MPGPSLALVTTTISPLSLSGRDWGLNIDLGPHQPRHTCYSLSSPLSLRISDSQGQTEMEMVRVVRGLMVVVLVGVLVVGVMGVWDTYFLWLCPRCLTEWQPEATVQLCTVYAHLSSLLAAGCLSSSKASSTSSNILLEILSCLDTLSKLNLRILSRWPCQQHRNRWDFKC